MVIIKKKFIDRYSKIIRAGSAVGIFPVSFKLLKNGENDEEFGEFFYQFQLKGETIKFIFRY